MRRMISVGRRGLGRLPVVSGGRSVARAGTARRPGSSRAARMRERLAPRPDPVRVRDPDRDDRRAGPQGEHREAVLRLLERAGRAARALGEHEQDVALVEDPLGEPERLDVRRAAIDRDGRRRCAPSSRRPASRTAPSCRASGSAGRASASGRRRSRRVGVREVVGGEDHRSLARDRVESPSIRDAGQRAGEEPGAGGHGPDERREVAAEELLLRDDGLGRRLASCRPPRRLRSGDTPRARRRGSPRTHGATVSSKRLPSVTMWTASSAARSGATAGCCRARRAGAAASRMRPASSAVGRQAALLGPAPGPLLDRRVEEELQVRRRAGRPCRCRGRP